MSVEEDPIRRAVGNNGRRGRSGAALAKSKSMEVVATIAVIFLILLALYALGWVVVWSMGPPMIPVDRFSGSLDVERLAAMRNGYVELHPMPESEYRKLRHAGGVAELKFFGPTRISRTGADSIARTPGLHSVKFLKGVHIESGSAIELAKNRGIRHLTIEAPELQAFDELLELIHSERLQVISLICEDVSDEWVETLVANLKMGGHARSLLLWVQASRREALNRRLGGRHKNWDVRIQTRND